MWHDPILPGSRFLKKKKKGGGGGLWQDSARGGVDCTDASRLHESFITSALLNAIFSSEADV